MFKFTLSLLIGLGYFMPIFAQTGCADALEITDLTGSTCVSTIASTSSWLLPASCEEGANETWFKFTAQGSNADINITTGASSAGFHFDPEFFVISSSDNTCAGALFETACFDLTTINYSFISGSLTGLTIGDTYWIAVTSHFNDFGSSIEACVSNPAPIASCVDNQECVDADVITLNVAGAGPVCVVDCNTGASSGNIYGTPGCADQPNETVWFEFTVAANTATIDISIASADLDEPEYTLLSGNSCSAWVIVDCEEGTLGSVNTSGISISAGGTYVLGVSDVGGDEGDFTLCIEQNEDNSACNTTNNLEVTETSFGSPLTGPFAPGETVSYRYTITDYQQVNCNYLGAVVPSFGNGWDPISFDANGQPVVIDVPISQNGVISIIDPADPAFGCTGNASAAWGWKDHGESDYNINGFYTIGTLMPKGWYTLSKYNPTTGLCFPLPIDPDDTYGDGPYPTCTNTYDYTVEFDLKVGSATQCASGQTDLTVSMKTFADGEFGIWNSLGCTADQAKSLPSTIDCAVLPIELDVFEGEYNTVTKGVDLMWNTFSEQNTSHFEISRYTNFSLDKTVIGTVEAAVNSNNKNGYSFTDLKPHPGVNYYNLKTFDRDGASQDHGFITVLAEFDLAYFDKSRNKIIMQYASEVEIYAMDGKLVKKSEGVKDIDFNLKGIYLIRDITNNIVQKVYTF